MEKTKQKITKGIMIALFSIMTIAFSFLYVKMCQDKYTAGMFVRTFVTIFVSALAYYGFVKAESFLEKYQKIILGIFLAVMLILQIVAGYYMQITPQWDFGSVYHAAVQWAEQGDFPDYKEYFYWFNNNLGELGFLTVIFKVAKAVGIKDYNMTATVVNAVLNVCMMLLAFLNCKRITTSVKNGFFVLFIFAVSIPSYLGASVFYTDVFSMVYPMLVLYLYLRLREETTWKKRILYGGLMALAAWIGCEIKYTVLIIVIAIVIEVLLRAEWKKALLIVGCSLAVFGLLLFLVMWETNARYIVNYIPMIYVAAVLGMAQVFAFAGRKLSKRE